MPAILTTPFTEIPPVPTTFLYQGDIASHQTTGDYTSFVTTSGATIHGYDFVKTNGQGQAIGADTGNPSTFYRSNDGKTWTSFTIPLISAAVGITWHNDRWIAVGSHTTNFPTEQGFVCSESLDGISWTTLFQTTANTYNPAGDNCLVSDGTTLTVSAVDGTGFFHSVIARSADGGTTWGTAANHLGGGSIGDGPRSLWLANGLYVMSTFNFCRIWTSPTGLALSWSNRGTIGPFNAIGQVEYGAGYWLMQANASGNFLRSSDGITWTTVPNGPWPGNAGGIQSLSYDPTHGWLISNGTTSKYSTDTTNWFNTNLAPGTSSGCLRMELPGS